MFKIQSLCLFSSQKRWARSLLPIGFQEGWLEMRRCHFLGPHLFFFSFFRRWQPDPLLCLLCIHPLCPRTSRQCDGGVFLGLPLGAPDVHLPRHRIKHRFNHPVGAGAGSAFVLMFVSAAVGPGGRRRPRPPRRRGLGAGSAWWGFHGRRRPGLFRYIARPGPLHPDPSTLAGAAQEPSMAFLPTNPAFYLFPCFLIFPR